MPPQLQRLSNVGLYIFGLLVLVNIALVAVAVVFGGRRR